MAKNEEIYEYLVELDDDGNAINLNVETKQTSLGANFEDIIYPVELIVEIELGNNIQMMVSYDGGAYLPAGTAKRGLNRLALDIDVRTGEMPRCRQINIAYKEFSKSSVRLGRLAVLYYDSDEVEEEESNAVESIQIPTARGSS